MVGGYVDDGEQRMEGEGRGEDIKMLDDEGSLLEVGLDRGWRGDRFLAVGRQVEGKPRSHGTRQHAYSL